MKAGSVTKVPAAALSYSNAGWRSQMGVVWFTFELLSWRKLLPAVLCFPGFSLFLQLCWHSEKSLKDLTQRRSEELFQEGSKPHTTVVGIVVCELWSESVQTKDILSFLLYCFNPPSPPASPHLTLDHLVKHEATFWKLRLARIPHLVSEPGRLNFRGQSGHLLGMLTL